MTESSKSSPTLGREICRAVGHATGIGRIRHASIAATYDDVTIISVDFVATNEQVQAIGEYLAKAAPGAAS